MNGDRGKRPGRDTVRGFAEPDGKIIDDDKTVPHGPPVAEADELEPKTIPAEPLNQSGELDAPPPPAVPKPAPVPTDAAPQQLLVPQQKRRGTPVVEIEVVHEHGPAPSTDRPWRTLEVWTRNRVYTLNSVMTCVEVTDRATRERVASHPFLGMRLVGGQHREGEVIELSYPFPRPGTEAVFEHAANHRRGSFSRTSAVNRVVLRLHIVTVSPNYVVPTWEEITGAFAAPVIKSDKKS